ncbi:hypothetical protein D3C76_1272970 [compost metagenome]
MSMDESSGMAATASWIIASRLPSSRSVSSSVAPRGCLPINQGAPYFSVNRTQNFRPPFMKVTGQKHMLRSGKP